MFFLNDNLNRCTLAFGGGRGELSDAIIRDGTRA